MALRTIFLAAIEKTDLDDRRVYLDRVCGSDVALRERVESLLQSVARSADGSPPLEAPPPVDLGMVGPYRLLEILGVGGMGVVYLAEDQQLLRRVAVKALRPHTVSDPEARERFVREARMAALIENEHVVPIYQVGEDDGVPYLVMPHLKGEPLDRWLRRTRTVPVSEILRLGREITTGLAAAHVRGLIHRDIKPANVWLEHGPDPTADPTSAPIAGKVKLLDFGLALSTDVAARLTQPGFVVGTPEYMAPEQAIGQSVDHRCDLFSVGVLLYEMSAREKPFKGGTTMAILTALAVQTPRPLTALRPDLPPALTRLVMQLIEKDPALRPQTAAEVIERLRAIERSPAGRTSGSVPSLALMASTLVEAPARMTGVFRKVRDPAPITEAAPTPRGALAAVVAAGIAVLLMLGAFLALRGPSSPEATTTTSHSKGQAPAGATALTRAPVKVYLLGGDSNMSGKGRVSTLDWLGKDPNYSHLLAQIREPSGREIVREDVWVYFPHPRGVKSGRLTVGFGDTDAEIGPELMFGHVMGNHHEAPVLLVKVTQGDLILGVEGRPPSSGGLTGRYFGTLVNTLADTLTRRATVNPDFGDRGYEIAGFVWFQGWSDHISKNARHRATYAENLSNLIRDVRQALRVPRLPVVVGEFGIMGAAANPETMELRKAQATAIDRPEFAGTVALARTADLWDSEAMDLRKRGFSPTTLKWIDPELRKQFEKMGSDDAYHYLGSGRMMATIGYRLGEKMKELIPP